MDQTEENCMVPIGGGNPYWHCKYCGVTNVELNMGDKSAKHGQGCPVREITELKALLHQEKP